MCWRFGYNPNEVMDWDYDLYQLWIAYAAGRSYKPGA